jgi:hypothetical protein
MATKQRNQNPTVGDTIDLRWIVYNSNNFKSVLEIQKVDIYFLDPNEKTTVEPCGKRLVETITPDKIITESEGNYLLSLTTSNPTYTIGAYQDIWTVVFETNDQATTVANNFRIYPDLWYTSTTPAVYSFDFHFQPNRIRQGSIKWLIIRIDPNVPTATELQRYYTNLAISADLKIWIAQACGPCVPPEEDLRLIVDGDDVTVRDKVFGFYKLDTTDMDCGVYDLWVQLEYAGNIDVSSKMQLLIY